MLHDDTFNKNNFAMDPIEKRERFMFRTASFEKYLQDKYIAKSTINAYRGDLRLFTEYCSDEGLSDLQQVDSSFIQAYFSVLEMQGRSGATIRRVRSCLNTYFSFLQKEEVISKNPVKDTKTSSRKNILKPEFLTQDEMNALLDHDFGSDEKGLRDKAMLELLYASGIKISSLIEIKVKDYDHRRRTVFAEGRKIPLYPSADLSLRRYLQMARPYLVQTDEDTLFVNLQGQTLTRQGLWKILRHMAEEAGIQKKLSPRLLRRSFAVHLLENGAEVEDLEKMMGLTDKASALAYLKYLQDDESEEVYIRFHPRAKSSH